MQTSPLKLKISNRNRCVFLCWSLPLELVRRPVCGSGCGIDVYLSHREASLQWQERNAPVTHSPWVLMTSRSKQRPEHPNVKAAVCTSTGPGKGPTLMERGWFLYSNRTNCGVGLSAHKRLKATRGKGWGGCERWRTETCPMATAYWGRERGAPLHDSTHDTEGRALRDEPHAPAMPQSAGRMTANLDEAANWAYGSHLPVSYASFLSFLNTNSSLSQTLLKLLTLKGYARKLPRSTGKVLDHLFWFWWQLGIKEKANLRKLTYEWWLI